MHASAMPAQLAGVSSAGAKASAATMVTGRRMEFAKEWDSADLCRKEPPVWPASAAHVAGRPRLAGSLGQPGATSGAGGAS